MQPTVLTVLTSHLLVEYNTHYIQHQALKLQHDLDTNYQLLHLYVKVMIT